VLSVPNWSDRFGKPVRPVLATVAAQVHIKRNQASSTSLKIKKGASEQKQIQGLSKKDQKPYFQHLSVKGT
jgi:hypothetical protein